MGDSLTLFVQLKTQYSQLHDPLYGDCLVIPTKAFQNDWYETLRSEGHKTFQGTVDGRAVLLGQLKETLVSKTDASTSEPKPVYEPKPEQTRKKHTYGISWTQDEDKELIKGVTLGLTDVQIAEKLPGRTEVAVKQRKNRLKKYGLLPGRKGKRGRPPGRKTSTPAPDPTPQITESRGPEPAPTPIDAPAAPHTEAPAAPARESAFQIRTTLTINLNVNCNDANSVENALKVLHEARRI